ncbi:hypothetical protein BV378_20930 [Nostoc sp. RF31YmG]|nr:hypothetical protein BV378_20930 [Nostoc sp. RF31YmG]
MGVSCLLCSVYRSKALAKKSTFSYKNPIALFIEIFRIIGLSTNNYIADLVAIAILPLDALGRWIFNHWVQKLIVEGLEVRTIFELQRIKELPNKKISHRSFCKGAGGRKSRVEFRNLDNLFFAALSSLFKIPNITDAARVQRTHYRTA